jgi:Family of unknown function (DUF5678)
MSITNHSVPTVPKKFAGQWIAWNRDRTAIIASGRTFDDARRAAEAAGEKKPILAKAPRADVRFLGGIR